MELDCYQHYFLDDLDTGEDFYKSTAPSEDIWKKFELLPTPPMSPTRTFSGAALHFPLGDKLCWSSKFLGHEDDCLPSSRPELCANLSSIIIRDCMWSSFSASKQLEKVSGKAAVAAVNTSVCALPQIAVRAAKAQCVSAATDCVDPAAVLTIPATNSCRKPASSGSESRSESSDEDEEEIDVVTVEKSKRMQLMNVRKPVTIRVRADPCPKRFHVSVHRQQHNYAARSPDSEPEPEEEDEEEEEEEEDDYEEPQCKRSCAGSDTSLTSDTEDTDRRKNHNFLERKRRNDLRSRFLALRDQIPGLEASKTPKVAILTHATEYLDELHNQERRQLQEKKRLKGRQQQLLKKLSELKRS